MTKCKLPKLPEIQELDKCFHRSRGELQFCESVRERLYRKLRNLYGKEKYGGYRSVFLSKKCAIKIPQDYHGVTSNYKEKDTWELVKDTPMAKYFTPVDDSTENNVVITMPRVKTGLSLKSKYMIVGIIENGLQDYGLYCENLSTLNVGELKGEPVVFDYGGYPASSCGLKSRPKTRR